MSSLSALAQNLMTALGCGLLIGLERERRKGHGPDRLPAGIRTFSLAAVCGAVAGQLNQPTVVVAAAVLIGIITEIAAYKRRGHDPGITTALALLLTYLLGVLAVTQPLLAAATSVVVTAQRRAKRTLLVHFMAHEELITEFVRATLDLATAHLRIVLTKSAHLIEPITETQVRMLAHAVIGNARMAVLIDETDANAETLTADLTLLVTRFIRWQNTSVPST